MAEFVSRVDEFDNHCVKDEQKKKAAHMMSAGRSTRVLRRKPL
jgi:hypothetical protein